MRLETTYKNKCKTYRWHVYLRDDTQQYKHFVKRRENRLGRHAANFDVKQMVNEHYDECYIDLNEEIRDEYEARCLADEYERDQIRWNNERAAEDAEHDDSWYF